MKPVLALSLAPLGAGWAFGAPDAEKPFSGFLTFGSNMHTDDELFCGAQREVLASIIHHQPQIVAVTAVSDDRRFAPRLFAYQVIARAIAKAKLPGAAKLVDIRDALECFTGQPRFDNARDADKAAKIEARRRLWLGMDDLDADRASALAVWCHVAAQQLPELKFNPKAIR
jgi:hypothetical protein